MTNSLEAAPVASEQGAAKPLTPEVVEALKRDLGVELRIRSRSQAVDQLLRSTDEQSLASYDRKYDR